MDVEETFAAITAQRYRLADRLATMRAAEWDTPSLCAGWRNREVVGHLLSLLEKGRLETVVGIMTSITFDRYNVKMAKRFGAGDPVDLVARLRSRADQRFKPPVLPVTAPLSDVCIHSRDIERPLGLASELDPGALRDVLSFLTSGRAVGFVRRRTLRGVRFEATDLDWAAGNGSPVRGTGEALMMAITGRPVGPGELDGDGAAAFATRPA